MPSLSEAKFSSSSKQFEVETMRSRHSRRSTGIPAATKNETGGASGKLLEDVMIFASAQLPLGPHDLALTTGRCWE